MDRILYIPSIHRKIDIFNSKWTRKGQVTYWHEDSSEVKQILQVIISKKELEALLENEFSSFDSVFNTKL